MRTRLVLCWLAIAGTALGASLRAETAGAQLKDNWVQRVKWEDHEIIAAFRAAFNNPLPDADILGMYDASQAAASDWQIQIGHVEPHFALRFNAELHGYNPRLVRGAQAFLNRQYSSENIAWDLRAANASAGAASGNSPMVNNPKALAALQATEARYPGVRVRDPSGAIQSGGPYMDQINSKIGDGRKYYLKSTRKGFELLPREPPLPLAPPSNGLNLTALWRARNIKVPYTPSFRAANLVLAAVSLGLHATHDDLKTLAIGGAGAFVGWELGTRATVKLVGWAAGEKAAAWIGSRFIPVVGWTLLAGDIILSLANRYYGTDVGVFDVLDYWTGNLDKPTRLAGPPPPPDAASYYD